MRRPSESALVRACLHLLALRGVPCWRANTGSVKIEGRFVTFNVPGCPDILGILPGSGYSGRGRFLGVECKMPGRRQSAAQRAFGEKVAAAGGVYLIVTSIKDLQEALEKLT